MVNINNNNKVFRDDWEFSMDDVENYVAYDSGFIHNDDYYGGDSYDYMNLEDYEFCRDVDDALYAMKHDLEDLLWDRVYLEFDVNLEVVGTIAKVIRDEWDEDGDWEDAIRVIQDVNTGRYDDDLKYYYTYLQATSLLENLYLIDFNDEPVRLEESLEVNNITVDDDEVEFSLMGTRESVERTDELEEDVRRLLEIVIDELKRFECYTDIDNYIY